jgi:POT family proton-dependent oligopeptide transporter
MGERFGFYTMMAILVLFLQAKYGLTESQAGSYYSWFYFSIYALALVGGLLADWTKKYKLVIFAGIVIMFAGYLIMGIPGNTLTVTLLGLFTIAFGNGLFKGNLQAVVGQMYDNPQYSKVRDSAFMIFYMGINIGAFFAPFAATAIRNWFLKTQGFLHDGSLPAMCHAYMKGEVVNTETFQTLAQKASISGQPVSDLGIFAQNYIEAFSKGYNYAFLIAAGAMVISLLVYIIFNKYLPAKDKVAKAANASGTSIDKMPWAEEKKRLIALGLVFIVVIFFWMSFHQNGLTLTFFARDYTVKDVGPFTNIFFNLESMLSFIAAVAGLFMVILNKKLNGKLIGGAMLIIGGALTYYFVSGYQSANPIAPEVFQSFNPLFIVALTFPVMGVFAWLNKKNIEPSTPKKIGIGMIIASAGFLVILVGSMGLISPHELQYVDEAGKVAYNPVPDTSRVVPYWLISSYLTLTIAELFLSPMGLSFVSKVAPPRFQGLMQGGWLLATALGNKLLFVGSFFWGKLDLWQLWLIFIVCCLLSAAFIFSIMKRLENATR